MIVTNHTYDVVGSYIPTKEMGGGSGLKYAASTIVYLSKKKEKDGTDVVGNIIKVKAAKSRLTKENAQIETRLFYDDEVLTDITDYWSWVKSMESSSGLVTVIALASLMYILNQSLLIQKNTSPKK
ncbi:MAG: hypothetical protein CM15mV6_1550 [uncultured marine virus]|nr:MAG: hypothetical protein CM15mV6_1550 [uncultured marine virus]